MNIILLASSAHHRQVWLFVDLVLARVLHGPGCVFVLIFSDTLCSFTGGLASAKSITYLLIRT